MNEQFTVQKAVGLRPQPQFHRGAAAAADTLDAAGSDRRGLECDGAGATTAASSTATTSSEAAAVRQTGVGDDTELALSEILAVEVEVHGILAGQKCATGRVTDASGESRALLALMHGLNI